MTASSNRERARAVAYAPSLQREIVMHGPRVGAFLLLMASQATAQNLTVNGEFDGGLQGWTVAPAGQVVHSELDIDGIIGSGSALLTNAEAGQGQRVYPLTQCVVVMQPGFYRVGVAAFMDSNHAPGTMVFSYALKLNSQTCDGSGFAVGGRFLDDAGRWARFERELQAPLAPATFFLQLGIEKAGAGGTLSGHFDAITIEWLPKVFRDGFE
jgi:hypothetical protein